MNTIIFKYQLRVCSYVVYMSNLNGHCSRGHTNKKKVYWIFLNFEEKMTFFIYLLLIGKVKYSLVFNTHNILKLNVKLILLELKDFKKSVSGHAIPTLS